ncbi:MAG TPA: MerR family transcriptional regulator, partial [Yinghuangia sp.]|nr:MerR family transcriptional regulator [Yinghuangia sp.]
MSTGTDWSITEVARMSGVTSRTLRHDDAIGLLCPASTGPGGVRRYGEGELLRLQRILVLRELGFGLKRIAATLAEGGDELAALRRHHAELVRERDRLSLLARTVARTIAEREKAADEASPEGGRMSAPQRWFEGFDAARYEDEARARWGDTVVDASNRQVARLSAEEKQGIQERFEAIVERLAGLLGEGVPADDPRTLGVVAEHYRWVSLFWTPDADAYAGLARLYVDDARFAEVYDRVGDGLAAYLSEAMTTYALTHLV